MIWVQQVDTENPGSRSVTNYGGAGNSKALASVRQRIRMVASLRACGPW